MPAAKNGCHPFPLIATELCASSLLTRGLSACLSHSLQALFCDTSPTLSPETSSTSQTSLAFSIGTWAGAGQLLAALSTKGRGQEQFQEASGLMQGKLAYMTSPSTA